MSRTHSPRRRVPSVARRSGLGVLAALVALTGLPAAAALASPYAPPSRLQAAADWMQMQVDNGGFTSIDDGPTLREGDTGPRVAQLCERLREDRDLEIDTCSETFDARLGEAVGAFQRRHGIVVDNLVGPETLKELNVPAEDRLRQIQSNIARQQAFLVAEAVSPRYVFVNVPDFDLMLMDHGERELQMNVIVGQEGWETPTIHDAIEYLELNPDWDVPPSIVAAEIAPAMRKSSSYLDRKNMVMFEGWGPNAKRMSPSRVDWGSVTESNFKHHIRQLPGPNNPLGQIKFMFPNDHAVYLHGTPNQSLFQRDVRAFSHGCIRVEDPPKLAEALLEGRDGWDLDRINQVTAGNDTQQVKLDEKVPVHIVYWTAFVDTDGAIHFRRDPWNGSAFHTELFEKYNAPDATRLADAETAPDAPTAEEADDDAGFTPAAVEISDDESGAFTPAARE